MEDHQGTGRDGERLFRGVFEGALDALLLADDQGTYVDANPAACEVFGLAREQLVGRNVADFAEPGLDVRAAWKHFLAAGRAEGPFRVWRSDGSTRDLDFRATANIAPGLHLSVMRDVTEARRTESRFRAMIERSLDGVSLADADGRVLYTSPAVETVFRVKQHDAVGTLGFDFIAPDDRERVRTCWEKALTMPGTPSTYEWRTLPIDGAVRVVESTVTNFLADPTIGAVVVNFRDVTERKRADETRNRLAAIVESSDDAILSKDLRGLVTSWNRGAERLYQWRAEEVIGQPIARIVPETRIAEEADLLARTLDGRPVTNYETTRLRKDGTLVPVALTLSPIRDGDGRTVGVSKIARDLTARYASEATLKDTQDQLRQAQKMEAIGALAGGVAHDFNNLLSVILGYTNIVLAEMTPDDPLRPDIDEVHRAGERAADLTRQLLAFSRRQVLEPRVLDLRQVLTGMEKIMRRLLGEDIDLSFAHPRTLGNVHADPSQLEQVVMNLAVNARDAMPDGGRLSIETANLVLDPSSAPVHQGIEPGPYVLLSVTDTGLGMDDATRARIFEPFFTTKDVGKGTGLGLSMVFGIVKQSQGHICVKSTPGAGTTFEIYLPRTEQLPRNETAPPVRAPRRGTETVLVVEDEEQVRAMMLTVLRRQGYSVLDAQNAGEAFLICEKHPGPIHLLLTDVVMPRMNGRALAARLAPMRPEMRVLYVSGYVETSALRLGLEGAFAFLQKPLTPESLLRKVSEVLEGATGAEARA